MLKIYIAGSISGKSYDEVSEYFSVTRSLLSSWGYKVFSPMTAKGHLRTEKIFRAKDYQHPISTNRAIVGRDKWMVGQSDVVYFNLSNADIASIGSVFEMAWANEMNKHSVAVIPEDNIHQHAFVLQSVDIIFDNEKDALDYLRSLIADLL